MRVPGAAIVGVSGFVVVFGFIAGLIFLVWTAIERSNERKSRPRPTPAYHVGSFVQTKIGGYRGQVVGTSCWRGEATCTYDVRFAATQGHTNTTLWGRDGSIEVRPLALVENMREYELEAVK